MEDSKKGKDLTFIDGMDMVDKSSRIPRVLVAVAENVLG